MSQTKQPPKKMTPRRMFQKLSDTSLPALWTLAVGVGFGMGLVTGRSFLSQGFAWLTASEISRHIRWALLVATGFWLLYVLLKPLVRRLLGLLGERFVEHPWALWVPAALAAAPWIAWGGLEWNRSHGLRPSILFESYALRLNGQYLLACLLLWALAVWCLGRPVPSSFRARWTPVLIALLVSVGLEVALAQAFQQGSADKRRPDVLVLLVDALRADHLSVYGAERSTPAMDSLAADGVLFRHAISQSTFTKSSIASLFTGRHVYQHGVYWGSHKETPESIKSDLLSLEETTLAETLSKQGYLTNAWVQNSHLRDFMGFGQGFVDYNDQQGSIQRIHGKAFPFFGGAAQRYNFFTYLHYIDLHDPYLPGPPYDTLYGDLSAAYDGIELANWGTYLAAVRRGEVVPDAAQVEQFRNAYDGLIRMVDDEIGRLIAELKHLGLYDSTLIVLTSDHGDAFMEHGFISHSTTPYEELSRIPLIVKLPKQQHAGTVVEPQVRLVDVMPTVLSSVGLDIPRPVAGCDLQSLWAPSNPARAANCLLAVSEIAEDGGYPTVAVRSQRFKYLHFETRDDELYDLVDDPLEQRPLRLEDLPEDSDARREGNLLMQHALEVHSLRSSGAEQVELDEQQIRELKALGYLD